jgi:hypothetical protein
MQTGNRGFDNAAFGFTKNRVMRIWIRDDSLPCLYPYPRRISESINITKSAYSNFSAFFTTKRSGLYRKPSISFETFCSSPLTAMFCGQCLSHFPHPTHNDAW